MKHFLPIVIMAIVLSATLSHGQNFSSTPVDFSPVNLVEIKMNLPIIHLDVNDYVPSRAGIYAGQAVEFRFYNRVAPWTNPSVFMRVRWDSDLDAGNGVTYTDWFSDEEENKYATVMKTYSVPGRYTIQVDIEFFLSNGSQAYHREKQIVIFVAPAPTAVYADQSGNRLFYWVGYDNIYNKPALLVEGYDPDNSTTPEINYMLGSDLIEVARGQGYDLFIMEWGNGGADLAFNKDVFLGACQFLHRKLGTTEAAVQVVGISMGGVAARYGLGWAEDDINPIAGHEGQHIDHYVNTFISFDSPQQGAHLNTNLQNFIKDRGSVIQQQALTAPAALQMLYKDVYDPIVGSTHDAFYGYIQNLHNNEQLYGYTNGYPRRCKNFAVSNGNRNANYPNKTTNDLLANYNQHANIDIGDIGIIHISQTDPIYAQQRDLWPGSTFTHDMTNLSSEGNFFFYHSFLGIRTFSVTGNWRFQVYFNPGYTPTESSLDFKNDYTRAADGSLIGGTSWFNDYLTQTTFHRHEELTTDSKNKVMDWLNANRTNPYLAQQSQLTGVVNIDRTVRLNFVDESAFESGFKIERRMEGGVYAEIGTLGPNQSQFIDSDPGLQSFKTYYYRVRSFSNNGYSAYSQEVPVFIQPHLASATATALTSNGQHKILQTSGYPYIAITYESGGGSFLALQDQFDGSWTPEMIVGGVPTSIISYRNPTLVPDSTGLFFDIALEKFDASTSAHNVILYTYSPTGNIFKQLDIGSFTGNSSIQAMPVAAMTPPTTNKPSFLAAAWRTGSTVMFGIGAYGSHPYTGNFYDWSTIDLQTVFGPTVSSATNLSLAVALKPLVKPVPNFYLVWEEPGPTGGIRFISGLYESGIWPPNANYITWPGTGSVYHVADNSSTETNTKPTITLDGNGDIHIAWESSNGSQGSIKIQKRDGELTSIVRGSWTAITSTGSQNFPHNPSLTDYRNAPTLKNCLSMVWNSSSGTMGSQFDGNIWGTPYVIDASGLQAQAQIGSTTPDIERTLLFTKSSGSIFALSTTQLTIGQPSLSWGTVLDGNGVRYPQLNWTTHFPGNQTFALYNYNCPFQDGNCESPRIVLTPQSFTGTSFTDWSTTVWVKGINGFTPNSVAYYYVTAYNDAGTVLGTSNKVNVNSTLGIDNKTAQGGFENEDRIPSRTELSTNYPNPFNPATTIPYQLASRGFVTLKLYNILGKEVGRLVEEAKDAGYYSAVWDASSYASGIYYVRLTVASNHSGNQLYQAVKKIVLLK